MLGTSCMFCHAWRQLHVLPCLAPVVHSPMLGTSQCMFSCTWHQLHVFPHISLLACLSCMLGIIHIFFCTCPWLCFLRSAAVACILHAILVACFPTPSNSCVFSSHVTGSVFSHASHQLHVLHVSQIACFPMLGISCI